ncbi:MAG: CDF family Co(II)/Ni(II) efflux transporter DmeF [Gammaproteobacteria bacterium]|nr:CDF family Co(II)/Ni(II) efflux transporter DmeF [Gammaproteobacteria bacterium]
MHEHTLENWQHSHNFSIDNEKGKQRTLYVLILTAITMVAEIIAGTVFGSMALLADGWHMGTHVAAFLITIYAYHYSSKHANNPAYAFGTGKVGVLGGFASAIALAAVALIMLLESIQRLVDPQTIQFNAAISVAVIGLVVNVVSAIILKDDHHHHHDHNHDHDHDHHHDHNLQAAYMHVIADALTSLLAIIALLSGKYFGWHWLDPMMGIVGAIIITRWSYGLLKQTSPILLDGSIDEDYQLAVKNTIEKDSDNKVSDIHIWKVSANHYAAIISLVTHEQKPIEHYKSLLSDFHKLSHTTIEVYECKDKPTLST